MTADNFTDAARAEAERKHPVPASYDPGVSQYERLLAQGAFRNGAEWARAHLAAQEQTNAAQIIDEHRTTGRWVGDGVRVECACGHISPGSHPGGPQTEEDNAHRDADRKHAAHVADMLARAARRDEEAR